MIKLIISLDFWEKLKSTIGMRAGIPFENLKIPHVEPKSLEEV
jgi:hypothetical protein